MSSESNIGLLIAFLEFYIFLRNTGFFMMVDDDEKRSYCLRCGFFAWLIKLTDDAAAFSTDF